MKPILINDLLNYKMVSNPTFSPCGKRILFNLTEVDEKKNSYKRYIYEYKDNKPVKLTGLGKETSYIFIDDNTIIFPSNRDDIIDQKKPETIYYKLSLNGGEASEYFRVPFNAFNIKKISEKEYIFIASCNRKYPDFFNMNDEEQKHILEEIEANKDYHIIDDYPYISNGSSYTNNERNILIKADIEKKEYQRITSPNETVESFSFNKEKTTMYYISTSFDNVYEFDKSKLFETKLSNLSTREIILPKGYVANNVFCASNFSYLIASNYSKYGLSANPDIFIIEDTNVSLILETDLEIGSSPISDVTSGGRVCKVDNDYLYFVSLQNEDSYVYKVNKFGEMSIEFNRPGGVNSFDIYKGEIIVSGQFDMRLQELYSKTKQLTHINSSVLEDTYVSTPTYVEFKNKDNINIHGYVLTPKDFDINKKYPAILDIHGGPKCAYGNIFFHEMQVWASKGYFVCFCNPRGSDGRGYQFSNIIGKYGTIDFEDIMSFMKECLKRFPNIDSNNLFETGGSYGGFMTNWIIGHTDMFKACASQRSISNWSIMYGISDIGLWFTYDQLLADPLNNPEKCWWHSPLKYAKNVTTPTLFIHSDEDYRCPLQEGLSMYTALKTNGVDSKIVIFKGENHELSRSGKPLHRIKRLEEITNWFEKYRSE